MSTNDDGIVSDEEFLDALTDPPTNKCESNVAMVEEVIQKAKDLKLPDDLDNEAGGPVEESNVKPELIDDIIDEEQLQEREKTMSTEELQSNKEKADKMKLEGNELFKNNEPEKSIELYTEALKICPTIYAKERAILYGNRAAAKVLLESKKSAIDDCSKAIELWPEYVRVLLRRAKLYEQEDNLDRAFEDFKRVCEIEPNQRDAREAVVRLPPIINERNERMKEEMMSKLKELGNMILNPFGLSTANFQMQQDPSTGSYSVNFNQNPDKTS